MNAIHVLLIEDDPDHSSLVRRTFQQQAPPIDVTIATDGVTGLEAIALRPYSLVLVDYSLPRMSGLDVLRQIQARGLSVPVVMVTGQGDERLAVEAMRAGAADYVIKTRDYFAALPAVVHKVVRQYELALDNSRLSQEVQRRLRETEGLLAMAHTLSANLNVDEIARRTTRELAHLLGADTSLFVQPDRAGDCFRPVAGYQVPEALGAFRYRIMPEDLPADACNGASPAHPAARTLPIQPHWFCYSPVLSNGRLFGALISYWWTEPRQFNGEDLRLAAGVANQMALALDNARLFADAREARDLAQRQRDQAVALAEVGRLIVASLDVDRILDAIVEKARDLLQADGSSVRCLDRETGALRIVRGVGVSPAYLAGHHLEANEGVSGGAVAEGRPVRSRDIQVDPRLTHRPTIMEQVRKDEIHAAMAAPIPTREGIFGALAVHTSAPRDFTPDEVALLASLAQVAGIAVENARLYAEVRSHAERLEARVRERTAALEATNAKLLEASRAKSAFLANMSHELRTPLHAIIGFTEILLGEEFGPLTASQKDFLTEVHESGHHLVALINDVLDLAKVEAGKVDLRPRPFNLRDMIAGVCDNLQALATEKQLQVTLATEEALPPLVADPDRIKQILYNLLSNAIKFTPQGGRVTISARKRADMADCGVRSAESEGRTTDDGLRTTEFLEISVADTGIGIAAENQARIFEAFEQGQVPGLAKPEGTGLGLAVSRQLVVLHGGTIRVESAGSDQGATFIVTLPLRPPAQSRRILLVEDEDSLRGGLCDCLTCQGYQVDEAARGDEALAAATLHPPDLVLLDIGLPDLDGRKVLARLRENPATAKVPVVVLTGLPDVHAEELLALGADEFLTKPFSITLLREVVARFLKE